MSKKSRAVAAVGILERRPNIPRTINVGSEILCADNSGAQILKIVQVHGVKTRLRQHPSAGIGDLVSVTVKKGPIDLRKKVMHAVIIRQRMPYRRPDGTWISFEDTAAVLVTPEGDVKATEIKGPVAREAAERWPRVANIAGMII
ncbi:MAG: 50S ribosomal protein L14 [Aigarchaeota archaeon]|nr:50S ribosomal protein L14 [Aigarchaeota archaeon]MCX8193133.1 50S ribosomal protein L14 [Nitrososphaeria archaeon]MDW7986756.1 50S ribosomal protein L14 [Nitrososphaerota archaeon]